ncbi:MAG: hypothetical protein ACR2Q3_01650 [Woeseiaceae bacterium]
MTPTGPLQKAIVDTLKACRQPTHINLSDVPGFTGVQLQNAINRLVNGGVIVRTDDGFRLASRTK